LTYKERLRAAVDFNGVIGEPGIEISLQNQEGN
jgi:hypothetical protein